VAVRNRALGPLYAAHVALQVLWCRPHTVGVVETDPPWRSGRAVVLAYGFHHGFVLGWWRRTPLQEGEFSDEQWCGPVATPVPVDEIAAWEVIGASSPQESAGV